MSDDARTTPGDAAVPVPDRPAELDGLDVGDGADSPEIVTGDRIATDLLRTAVGRNGTIALGRGLAICLRAALLAELALEGAVADTGTSPTPTGTPPPDDRILAAVHRTVAARPTVAWRRWFRHVDVDLAALTDELVAADRWTDPGRRRGRRTAIDRDAGGALALGQRARAVGLGQQAPASAREAVLGVLAVCVGGAHGEAQPREAVALAPLLRAFEADAGERVQAAQAAVATARVVQRKARRKLF